MQRYFIAAVLVTVIAVFGFASVVNAQDENPTQPGKEWGRQMGQRMMNRFAGIDQMHEYMQQAMADQLGLTVEQLEERHANGETFWQIAEEQGLTVEEARQLKLDARSAALDQMVADGILTQEQADLMKERSGQMMNGHGRGGCMGGQNAPDGSTFPRGRMSRGG
jgi:hypothetical protein